MGKDQNIIGPVLCVPYQFHGKVVRAVTLPDGRVESREVEETTVATAYFLPDALEVSGDVQTQTLHRGFTMQRSFVGRLRSRDALPCQTSLRLRSIRKIFSGKMPRSPWR